MPAPLLAILQRSSCPGIRQKVMSSQAITAMFMALFCQNQIYLFFEHIIVLLVSLLANKLTFHEIIKFEQWRKWV